jgi:hypothetical protein
MPKVFNFFPAIRTRNDRADDQEQNIAEFVFNFSRLAVVLNDGEVAKQVMILHWRIPSDEKGIAYQAAFER